MEQNKIDLRGLFVPETIHRLEPFVSKMEDGDRVLILLDDMGSEDWITRWAHKNGHDVLSSEKTATGLTIIIKKGGYITQ